MQNQHLSHHSPRALGDRRCPRRSPHAALGGASPRSLAACVRHHMDVIAPTGHGSRPNCVARDRRPSQGSTWTFSPWRADSVISRFNTGSAQRPRWALDPRHVRRAVARPPERGRLRPHRRAACRALGLWPDPRRRGTGLARAVAREGDRPQDAEDLTLDLCGIAKGWALDRAAERVEDHGVRTSSLSSAANSPPVANTRSGATGALPSRHRRPMRHRFCDCPQGKRGDSGTGAKL
jgi:hypothetical protein